MVDKKKIAVYAPYFAGGGAEAVELGIVDALQYDYEVTIFTFVDVNINKLNQFYSTNIIQNNIKINYILSYPLAKFLSYLSSNNNFFRSLILYSVIAKMKYEKNNYDLLFSGYNAVDLGKKGIQYLHWVKVVEDQNKFLSKIFRFSKQQIKENISITNSNFTADAVKEVYGLDSTVIYPCVMLEDSQIPWEEKENAFICSGRLVMEKAPHRALNMLKEVRQKGFNIKLYLTGGTSSVYKSKYYRFLKKVVKENSDWVTLYENLSYQEYTQVLNKCKYGIHFKFEPFGISVAEMMKAGAIPFVKSRGGQMEIVGLENTELFFEKEKDGVKKIINVLKSQEKKDRLRSILDGRKNLFSQEKFYRDIKNFVDSFFV
ncbi:glycosyl transferase, group 1 [Cyanobacterium sp. HL-69]|uniref:glycosyltransferase n=1 Tax=Cyanobacterium sp. HL-69 TaxID=2054282 RepID=UPI000CA2D208|nr:glycosyl transferase, group 1 [Cyanobacterium sp. HL-69]